METLEAQVKHWLEIVLREEFPPESSLSKILADGVVLLRLAKIIRAKAAGGASSADAVIPPSPRTVKKKGLWVARSNVEYFVQVCKDVGLRDYEICSPSDIVDDGGEAEADLRRMNKICQCLLALAKAIAADFPAMKRINGLSSGNQSQQIQQQQQLKQKELQLPENRKQMKGKDLKLQDAGEGGEAANGAAAREANGAQRNRKQQEQLRQRQDRQSQPSPPPEIPSFLVGQRQDQQFQTRTGGGGVWEFLAMGAAATAVVGGALLVNKGLAMRRFVEEDVEDDPRFRNIGVDRPSLGRLDDGTFEFEFRPSDSTPSCSAGGCCGQPATGLRHYPAEMYEVPPGDTLANTIRRVSQAQLVSNSLQSALSQGNPPARLEQQQSQAEEAGGGVVVLPNTNAQQQTGAQKILQFAAPPPPPRKAAAVYEVQRGDTLSSIARQHGRSWTEVAQSNPHIRNPHVIYPNDRILLDGK